MTIVLVSSTQNAVGIISRYRSSALCSSCCESRKTRKVSRWEICCLWLLARHWTWQRLSTVC